MHKRTFRHKSGGLIASAECEPVAGVWGQAPSGVQGYEKFAKVITLISTCSPRNMTEQQTEQSAIRDFVRLRKVIRRRDALIV